MTTIPCLRVEESEGLAREVYDEIMRTYDLKEPRESYVVMGHTPEHLAASWKRSIFLFGSRTTISLKDKHLLTLAVSAFNGSEYCVRGHADRVRQLGATNAQLSEMMLAVSMVSGASKRIIMTCPTKPGASPYIPAPGTLDRRNDQRFESATERLAHLCFETEGSLGLLMKHSVGYAVAAAASSERLVAYHGARLKELGVSDETLTEILLIVDLVCGYNRYGQGVQVGPPVSFGAKAAANTVAE